MEMDLIGSLPEDVTCHILSFLTTKEAVSTSVLSKKWRNMWTLVPSLDIDYSVFPEVDERRRNYMFESVMDVVDGASAFQADHPIKKFSLKCRNCVYTDRLNRWICNVLRRGVTSLELALDFCINIYKSPPDSMPKDMFVGSKLEELKLKGEFGVKWWRGEQETSLPMLKTLYIESEFVELHDKLEVFLSAFPVLEEFYLGEIQWSDRDETVSSASLKKLTIYARGFDDFANPKSISFDTPSLVSLDYSDHVGADYPKVNLPNLAKAVLEIVNLPNLAKAVLDLKLSPFQANLIRLAYDKDGKFLRFRNVRKLVTGIRHVKKLFLSADTLEVLSLCCDSIPVFNNLKFLRIASKEDRGWEAMPVLLRNCPHLETLVLEGLLHYVTDKCGDVCGCISREDKGRSLLSCPLKKMYIKGYGRTVREKEMVRHFFESFPCLDEIEFIRGLGGLEVARVYKGETGADETFLS